MTITFPYILQHYQRLFAFHRKLLRFLLLCIITCDKIHTYAIAVTVENIHFSIIL